MAGYNSFLNSIVTTVAAVTDVNWCERGVSIDPDRIVKIPRWPKVVVQDLGGALDDFSASVYERTMGITVIVKIPRGTMGGESSEKLSALSESIDDALVHVRSPANVTLLGDIDEVAQAVNGDELYMKTLIYSYTVER